MTAPHIIQARYGAMDIEDQLLLADLNSGARQGNFPLGQMNQERAKRQSEPVLDDRDQKLLIEMEEENNNLRHGRKDVKKTSIKNMLNWNISDRNKILIVDDNTFCMFSIVSLL